MFNNNLKRCRIQYELIEINTGPANCVACTSDGRFAVTGSSDCTAIVWDLESGTFLHTLKGGHDQPIRNVSITPNNILALTYNYTAYKGKNNWEQFIIETAATDTLT